MNTSPSLVCRFLVSGRVQGVGYRMFAARAAGGLGLTGGVTNLPDGRVEVVARGSAEALRRLEGMLARGPGLARVSHVEAETLPGPPVPEGWDLEF